MEGLPALAPAVPGSPILTQLHDHQLAHGVVEIARVPGSARGLLACIAGILIGLLAEQALGFLHAHATGVHANGGNKAHVAQQRVAQLADMRLGG